MNSLARWRQKQFCFVAGRKKCSSVHLGAILGVFGRFFAIFTEKALFSSLVS
jgi:hypothetical protein